jgi:hypothetical protein
VKRLLGQFLAALIVVALVFHFIWWIIAAGLFIGGCWLSYRAYLRQGAVEAAEERRLEGIRARADEQHRWVISGDVRGLYGEYPAAPL